MRGKRRSAECESLHETFHRLDNHSDCPPWPSRKCPFWWIWYAPKAKEELKRIRLEFARADTAEAPREDYPPSRKPRLHALPYRKKAMSKAALERHLREGS